MILFSEGNQSSCPLQMQASSRIVAKMFLSNSQSSENCPEAACRLDRR